MKQRIFSQSKATNILLVIGVLVVIFTTFTLLNSQVHGFGLKVAPLKYEESLELGSHKTGFIDVSNPNDMNVTVRTGVQAFRQINVEGDLEFYDDEHIAAGINVDVEQFDLGPREAARIFFTIDSNSLPEGGIYAAVFFSVDSQQETLESTSIATTTRVGTLLILENGDQGVREGRIDSFDISFWQFGSGLLGSVYYRANDNELSLAFTPELSASAPLVDDIDIETGMVFPGNTRRFDFNSSGNYLGVFPVEVSDTIAGTSMRKWVVAVTGIWQVILPALLITIVTSMVLYRVLSVRNRKRT